MGINNLFATNVTGVTGLQRQLDIIANNVANSTTTGYKARQASFQELLNQDIKAGVDPASQPLGLNAGLNVTNQAPDFKQGNLEETGRQTDLALNGPGFFGLRDANGNLYLSRDGAFSFDSDQNLVSAQGLKVELNESLPKAQWPKGTLQIGRDGQVYIKEQNQTTAVGQLVLYQAQNNEDLLSVGNNLYQVAPGRTLQSNLTGANVGAVIQGSLESANVDLAAEMSNLIIAQRSYSMNTQMLKANDELWEAINAFSR